MRRVLLLALLLVAVAGCGGGSSASEACRYTDDSSPTGGRGQDPPAAPLDAAKDYRLSVKTTHGTFVVALDLESAPCTAGSLVSLAKAKFFDGTVFHRIVPDFVIQGGDPTGTGTGGPGYKSVDVPASDARYTKGVVAMAKAGFEAPGTSGSQFFVVTGEDVGLPPDYAIVGRVENGLDVVEKIGKLGDASEQPTERVEIERVTVQAT